MRRTALGLVAALALASPAVAQHGNTVNRGLTTGAVGTSGLVDGGLGENAGGIAAAANSAANPSGNSFLNPPPGTGVPAVGRPAR